MDITIFFYKFRLFFISKKVKKIIKKIKKTIDFLSFCLICILWKKPSFQQHTCWLLIKPVENSVETVGNLVIKALFFAKK